MRYFPAFSVLAMKDVCDEDQVELPNYHASPKNHRVRKT